MRDAAEKVHRGFGIAVLELPVSRTHAAHGLELAVDALGRPGDLPLADTPEEPFPGHGECEYCEGGVGYEDNDTRGRAREGNNRRRHAAHHSSSATDASGAGGGGMLERWLSVVRRARVAPDVDPPAGVASDVSPAGGAGGPRAGLKTCATSPACGGGPRKPRREDTQ
jgi:hypothetical protein